MVTVVTIVEHVAVIEAPAERVWAKVRDFGDDSWTGVAITIDGTGVGAVRRVAMPTGPVHERCTRLDDGAMVLGYEIVSGNPFPATDQRGTVTVRAIDDRRCQLTWRSTYAPAPGAGDLTAEVSRFLAAATDALRGHVEV